MCSTHIKILCTVRLKLNVIKYVKQHSSLAAEKHFHPSPTKKMICEGKRQDKEEKEKKKKRSRIRRRRRRRITTEVRKE
jgi:hypothetical protein